MSDNTPVLIPTKDTPDTDNPIPVNRRRIRRNQDANSGLSLRSFSGETEGLDSMLRLTTERIDKNVNVKLNT